MPNSGKLYVIATPLGNRSDITLRALETLKSLRHFMVEDTREFEKLLSLYEIGFSNKNVLSCAKHNMKEATRRAVAQLEEGHDVGLICDRGTPCISDPGAMLVGEARDRGFVVIPIPGCSSIATALSVCGFDGDRFLCLGFLPRSRRQRSEIFELMEVSEYPILFFESPQRIRKTAAELSNRFSERRFFRGREMTKVFEEFECGKLRELNVERLVEKGEYTLILERGEGKKKGEGWEREVELRLSSDKEWSKKVASHYGVSAKVVYDELQRAKAKK